MFRSLVHSFFIHSSFIMTPRSLFIISISLSGLIVLLLAFIEQQTKKYGVYQPSSFLSSCALQLQHWFCWIGEVFAIVCGFLIQLKDIVWEYIKELTPSLRAIVEPLFEIIISPFYFFKGYIVKGVDLIVAHELPGAWNLFLFTAGTLVVSILILVLIAKFVYGLSLKAITSDCCDWIRIQVHGDYAPIHID